MGALRADHGLVIAQELLQGDRLAAVLWLLSGSTVIVLMLWAVDRRRR